ncbi:MAG TPA: VTT domain-containing protein [Bryobacteraceae bacterium]|nr:VTT domain-containing protein [Bryobacteraceae bacterium]
MDTLVSAVAQHRYAILFAFVFVEVIGLPLPAAPALIVAGGASANGPMQPAASLLTALTAMLSGDLLMYLLGRYTGWWLLGVLCRLSISPESCILRSADAFYKRGRAVLVFAKFVPGINALAAPLAGSMKMRMPQFVGFDLVGASVYILVYWGVGFLFSGFLGAITKGYSQFGRYVGWSIAVFVAGYLIYRAANVWRERNSPPVSKIRASELAARLGRVAVYDVRSHGYYERKATRIQGSERLEPNSIEQAGVSMPSREKEVVLYCTCVREATSVRVARVLAGQGYRVSVIDGGLRAWRKAGLPVERVPEDDVVQLPTFS